MFKGISSPQQGFHFPRVPSSLGPRTRDRVWRSCGSPTPLHRGRWEVVEREVGTQLPLGVVVGTSIPVEEIFLTNKTLTDKCFEVQIKHETRILCGCWVGIKLLAAVHSTSIWTSLRTSSSCSGRLFSTRKQQLNLLPIIKVPSFDSLKKIYQKSIGSLRRNHFQFLPSVSELITRTHLFRFQLVIVG